MMRRFQKILVLMLSLGFCLTGPGAARATVLPAYRASGTFTASTGSITPPYPASMAANDICLLAETSENQAISLTTANGFAELTSFSPQFAGTAGTDPASRLALYWKRTVGGDSAPVVADSGDNNEGVIHCFSGVTTVGNPWNAGAGGNGTSTSNVTAAIPGSTTTVNNSLIVIIESTSNNGTSAANCTVGVNADLANITERQDNSNTAGLGGGSCMDTGEKAVAGTYGTTTMTMSSVTFKGAISLALTPANPPTVTTNYATENFNSADLFGSITATGAANATQNGFAYGTDSTLATVIATTTLGGFTGTGVFDSGIGGLSASTVYYFRAYATNSDGTGYGSILSFTTGNSIPSRIMRLFEGFRLKIFGGKIMLFQQ